MPGGVRKQAGQALEIRKDAVTLLLPNALQGVGEEAVVVHGRIPWWANLVLT